jgi:hypothetical protein
MDEGMCCYTSMITVYMTSATLECNTCMVGLLCCTGHPQEAENMMKAMPCKPHVAPAMALLGNCRIHGNVEMGEHVAKQILGLEPGNAAGYMLGYQTSMLLLATGISLRMLNGRERKKVRRNSLIAPELN